MSTSTMSAVTERVTDVLSTGAGALQDAASIAVEQFESLPDRVADLTGSRRSSSWRTWAMVAAGVVAALGLVWWMRSRRGGPPSVDQLDDAANPLRSQSDRAVAAATGR